MAKQIKADKGTKPPAKPKEPKKTTKVPTADISKVTPADQIPKGKAKCQFCSHLQPLKRGDDSISRLQGTCEVTDKIVWMQFFCDKFLIKPEQP